MKILLIILDGLGDEPIPALGNKTPLEAAKTPWLDFLAKEGICGQVIVQFRGAIPTSEGGHFALFGYNPEFYKIRRGILTALGAGIKVKKGDVALRGNLATVDEKLKIIDRRAGRIKNPEPLIEALKGIKIEGVKFLIKSASEHRLGIVMRGRGLSPDISDGDPHYSRLEKVARRIEPLDRTKKAGFTAKVLNEFLERTQAILKEHPFNRKREKRSLLPANYILVRGASGFPALPSFEEKYGLKASCIAGKLLYKQIGKILGMKVVKVKGATGRPDTNLEAKFKAVKRALRRDDFVFLHIKATDSLAEDGEFLEKKKFIEKIDKNLKTIVGLKNVLIAVTADHSTCSLLKRHCQRPCPILIYGAGKDKVSEFSERACQEGKLGRIKQTRLMKKILKLSFN